MTLQVKRTNQVVLNGVSIPQTRWVTPTQIMVKRGAGFCSVREVYVRKNGSYCKVWPTPVLTFVDRVTTSADGGQFLGLTFHVGGDATFTTRVRPATEIPAQGTLPMDRWGTFWRTPGGGDPNSPVATLAPSEICIDFPAAGTQRLGTGQRTTVGGTYFFRGEIQTSVAGTLESSILSQDSSSTAGADYFQPGVIVNDGESLAVTPGGWQPFELTTIVGGIVIKATPYLAFVASAAGRTCLRNVEISTRIPAPSTVDNTGTVVFEYRAPGGTWATLGEVPVLDAGAAALQSHWPAPDGTYEFRARYVPEANVDPPRLTYLPSTSGPSRRVKVDQPGAGVTLYAALRELQDSARHKIGISFENINARYYLVGSVTQFVGYFGAPPMPAGALNGQLQVQWKLQGEPDSRWTNLGGAVAITNGAVDVPVTLTMGGQVQLRYVFTSSVPVIPPAISNVANVGTVVPPRVTGALTRTALTATSVAFGWAASPGAEGYGVFSDVVQGSSIARVTGTWSGPISCASNRFTSLWVRPYVTDRNGRRWYGESSDAYTHHGGALVWDRNPYQLHSIFETQPANP